MVLAAAVGTALAATAMLPSRSSQFEKEKQPMLRLRCVPRTLHLLFKLR